MSPAAYQSFRRMPVPPQVAQQLQVTTIPAPTRGIVMDENETFMQPGAALVCDNWKPTLKGVSLRGGCTRWCTLPDAVPIVSGFQYASGPNQRIFAAQQTKLFDVTTTTPVQVGAAGHAGGQNSGNFSTAQLANQGGDFLIAVNDAGDAPLRYNGTTWTILDVLTPVAWANNTAYAGGTRALDITDNSYWTNTFAHTSATTGTFAADRAAHPTYWTPDVAADGIRWITGPPGSPVVNGKNLVNVCKYRNRLYFIGINSMSAWYLPTNAVGGQLLEIPLSGAATRGGKLLFCATWSVSAGDGIDNKIVFCTDQGEILVFSGSDPSDADNWKQEGRYDMSPPLGMNAHISVGGDLLIAGVDGILPTSGALTKDTAALELAAITRSIKPMWRSEVIARRTQPWTICKWDEYGGMFVTLPGGAPGNQRCLVVNTATGAFARFTGWDAQCFMKMNGNMYFGTQTGLVMQADRTGYDDGVPYVATLVGGWEMFQSPSQTITWRQARASFAASNGEPFQPQLSATTDYVVVIPTPPLAGPDPGVQDLWDQGLWDVAKWDAGTPAPPAVRNTGWVSIGLTGYSHAPIVQVTVAQKALPVVDLISIAAVFERAGVNV